MFLTRTKFRRNTIIGFLCLTLFIFLHGLLYSFSIQSSVTEQFNNLKSFSVLSRQDSSEPLHVFIDLGANKGDSIYNFVGLNNEAQGGNFNYSMFPSSYKTAKWIIYGFEANSFFDKQLVQMKQDVENLGHSIHLFKSTAAWIYDGTIDFYLDTVNARNDFWGSSLNKKHVIRIII